MLRLIKIIITWPTTLIKKEKTVSNKINISVLCGGQSTEHEISILSARNVASALDKDKYHVSVIYITQEGAWYLLENIESFLQTEPSHLVQQDICEPITAVFGDTRHTWGSLRDLKRRYAVDCVFPVLHGTQGEDGTMQGLLEILNIAYVGSGVIGSAICMDKHTTKQLLCQSGLPTTNWVTLNKSDFEEYPEEYSYSNISKQLGTTVFVKPATLGSSVGISKVRNENEYRMALDLAFRYDHRVMVESSVKGREIECSVLGNDDPVASLPGEVVTASTHEFYSYTAKYLDPDGARGIAPADLPNSVVVRIQELSIKTFKVLQCVGMARVDFFVDSEEIIINEVNTIPGFTNISMYPKNWIATGISYSELLDDLIQLAMAHRQQKMCVKRDFAPHDHKQTTYSIQELK